MKSKNKKEEKIKDKKAESSTLKRYFMVGVIYRPPKHNLQQFVSGLDSVISRISKENKTCYVMADWNIDLMKCQSHD